MRVRNGEKFNHGLVEVHKLGIFRNRSRVGTCFVHGQQKSKAGGAETGSRYSMVFDRVFFEGTGSRHKSGEKPIPGSTCGSDTCRNRFRVGFSTGYFVHLKMGPQND